MNPSGPLTEDAFCWAAVIAPPPPPPFAAGAAGAGAAAAAAGFAAAGAAALAPRCRGRARSSGGRRAGGSRAGCRRGCRPPPAPAAAGARPPRRHPARAESALDALDELHRRVDLGGAGDPQLVHVEDQRLLAVVGAELEVRGHHDRAERAGLHAEGALDAAAHVQVEPIEDLALALGRVLLDLDDVDRAGQRAGAAGRAAQVAGVDVVDQARPASRPGRKLEPLLGILEGDRSSRRRSARGWSSSPGRCQIRAWPTSRPQEWPWKR